MNIQGFEAYLAYLKSYQSIIYWTIGVGLVITIVGVVLVFLMRETTGKEQFSFKTKEGHHFNFSSSFSGGLVSFSGSLIVLGSLLAMVFITPKIDGEG